MSEIRITSGGNTDITELAEQQIEIYRRQSAELISHYNREKSALDGYRGRQLLELLQNADDAGVDAEIGNKLLLNLTHDRLVVANTGKPFTKKGLTSLVISDCSPKQLERNRFIGNKGLGFRSVLTWTDRPLISSGIYDIVFDRAKAIETVEKLTLELPDLKDVVTEFRNSIGNVPAAVMRFPQIPHEEDLWLQNTRVIRAEGYDTVVVLPLPDGERGNVIYGQILDQLNNLPTSSLLFSRHLTKVSITGDLDRTWELLRQVHDRNHTTVIVHQGSEYTLWEVFFQSGQLSADLETNSNQQHDFEIAVAVPEIPATDPDGKLCVFFPTHESLPCSLIMHATLETTDDRNHLVTNESNREVLRQLAMHVAYVVENEASPSDSLRALLLLKGIENADNELKNLGFIDSLIQECEKRAIFPRSDNKLG